MSTSGPGGGMSTSASMTSSTAPPPVAPHAPPATRWPKEDAVEMLLATEFDLDMLHLPPWLEKSLRALARCILGGWVGKCFFFVFCTNVDF